MAKRTQAHVVFGLLMASCILGCGRGTGRLPVTGTVTWAGKPIPAGVITIEPDPNKGNTGPQSRVPFKDGEFQTAPDKGAVSGPVIVRVEGYTGKPHPENAMGTALFSIYETTAEISQGNQRLEIDVPGSHK